MSTTDEAKRCGTVLSVTECSQENIFLLDTESNKENVPPSSAILGSKQDALLAETPPMPASTAKLASLRAPLSKTTLKESNVLAAKGIATKASQSVPRLALATTKFDNSHNIFINSTRGGSSLENNNGGGEKAALNDSENMAILVPTPMVTPRLENAGNLIQGRNSRQWASAPHLSSASAQNGPIEIFETFDPRRLRMDKAAANVSTAKTVTDTETEEFVNALESIVKSSRSRSANEQTALALLGRMGKRKAEVDAIAPKNKQQPQQVVDDQPGGKPKKTWRFAESASGCREIVLELGLEIEDDILVEFNTPLDLFRHLERHAMLSREVLKLFSPYQKILSADLAPSYAGKVNEFNLVLPGAFPARKCTMPFYGEFCALKVLDLTNIELGDDELRYLIKLCSLQALGLSGTKVTAKGIKYLSTYAGFKTSLLCLKLCYVEAFNDDCTQYLSAFTKIQEIDLLGTACTLSGCLSLINDDPVQHCQLKKLRPPERASDQLDKLHVQYQTLARSKPAMVVDPTKISLLDAAEVRQQLKLHQKHYPDIFLNLAVESLRAKLREILIKRRKEEYAWSIQ